MEIKLHPEAELEFSEAAVHYGLSVPGLGEQFVNEFERLKPLLLANPKIGSPVDQVFRKVLFRRFPYSVLYTIEGSCIWLVAVAHHHRRPGYWRTRYER